MPTNQHDQRPLMDKASDAYTAINGGIPPNRMALEGALKFIISEYRREIHTRTMSELQTELDEKGMRPIFTKDWKDFCRMLIERATLCDRFTAWRKKEHWLNAMRKEIGI